MAAFGPLGWKRAKASIDNRGPDAAGDLTVDGVHMSHARLAIIGLGSVGAQPMRRDGDHALVFNGEIYNYKDIARELAIDADSDTHVIYEICRRGQWDQIQRLRGMYSFVHYNRTARRITAVRDPFGIKPLYVRRFRSGGLSFGSTAASLAHAEESVEFDLLSMIQFVGVGYFSCGTSPWMEIQKVPPATISQYRHVGGSWQQEKLLTIPLSVAHAADPISALKDSVEAHLVADVEVGIFLSGGVDSTLLAALATQQHKGIRTFSLTNPRNPDIDEGAYARHNAKLLGTDHLEVPVDPIELAPRALSIIQTSGEPFSDAAFLPLSALSEVTSQHVKVALAGEGADELFGGYRRYDIERLVEHPVLGPPLRLASQVFVGDRTRNSTSQRGRAAFAATLQSPPERHSALMYGAWDIVVAYFGEMGRVSLRRWVAEWSALSADIWALKQPAYRAHDTRMWLPNVYLEKSDRASMQHSLEVRTPFLDQVVAHAVAGLRPRNSRKDVLRRELQRTLPDVRLPTAKKGLAVDTATLTTTAFAEAAQFTTGAEGLKTWEGGLSDPIGLQTAASRRPTLAFRLAMLGLWQQAWLA